MMGKLSLALEDSGPGMLCTLCCLEQLKLWRKSGSHRSICRAEDLMGLLSRLAAESFIHRGLKKHRLCYNLSVVGLVLDLPLLEIRSFPQAHHMGDFLARLVFSMFSMGSCLVDSFRLASMPKSSNPRKLHVCMPRYASFMAAGLKSLYFRLYSYDFIWILDIALADRLTDVGQWQRTLLVFQHIYLKSNALVEVHTHTSNALLIL